MVVNLWINGTLERALLFTQPSGLILNDLGKLHEQSWMLSTTFRLLKGFLQIQACLNLLYGSSYYSSSPDQTLYMDFQQCLNSANSYTLNIRDSLISLKWSCVQAVQLNYCRLTKQSSPCQQMWLACRNNSFGILKY